MSIKFKPGSAEFRYGFSDPENFREWITSKEAENLIGMAFVGRSNVGKSTTINSIFGNKTARTSKTPGRTREINVFSIKLEENGKEIEDLPNFYLFDLPGYGFAEVSKSMSRKWEDLMGLFFELAPSSVLLINIQDARHPLQKADLKFYDYIKKQDFDLELVLNKVDKLKTQKERAGLEKKKKEIFNKYRFVHNIHFISAEKKKGIDLFQSSVISYLFDQFEEIESEEE